MKRRVQILGGLAITPLIDGCDALDLGGCAFLGLRISLLPLRWLLAMSILRLFGFRGSGGADPARLRNRVGQIGVAPFAQAELVGGNAGDAILRHQRGAIGIVAMEATIGILAVEAIAHQPRSPNPSRECGM